VQLGAEEVRDDCGMSAEELLVRDWTLKVPETPKLDGKNSLNLSRPPVA